MSNPGEMIRELTTGDVFALDRMAGELILIGQQYVANFRQSGNDMNAARGLVKQGLAQSYDRATLQKLQSALIHIQVLI